MSFLEKITKKSKSIQGGVSGKDGTEYSIVSLSAKDDAVLDARLFNRVVLIMSIAAMLLSVIPFSALSGLVLGAITLGLIWYMKQKGGTTLHKGALILSACAIFFGLIFAGISANNENSDKAQLAQTKQQLTALQEAAAVQQEEPVLSLEISGAEPSKVKSMQITVTGTTAAGMPINDTRTIVVGSKNVLGYPFGDYKFSYGAFAALDGKTLYKEGSVACSYEDGIAKCVPIQLVENTEEMQRVAAEQEAARQAAEAAAQAEAAAAEAAEQEAAQAQSSATNEHTVYITKTGEKYHSSGCQYLKKSIIAISESSAIAQGYTPCSKCNP